MAKNSNKKKKSKASRKKSKTELAVKPVKQSSSSRQSSDSKALLGTDIGNVVAKPEPDNEVPAHSVVSAHNVKKQPQETSETLASNSAVLLSIAAAIGLLMFLAAIFLPEGTKALRAFSGLPSNDIPVKTGQIFALLDTLFPVFFVSGLALLATSLQTRGNRPLVRIILTVLLSALVADMAENAAIFGFIKGGGLNAFQFPLTFVKFGGLAFAGVLLSVVLPVRNWLGQAVHIILRYLFPLAVALLMTEVIDQGFRNAVMASLIPAIFLLAAYAQTLFDTGTDRT